MVIWLIGLSGSGKTTIGHEIYKQWKNEEKNTVLVDGDKVREIFQLNTSSHDYSVDARRLNAERIQRICSWLDSQNINVVCCILSLFQDIHAINRNNLSRYYEVFIDVPLDTLIERDTNNLYKPALAGESNNVVGIDIDFTPPLNPDLIIQNNFREEEIAHFAHHILEKAR